MTKDPKPRQTAPTPTPAKPARAKTTSAPISDPAQTGGTASPAIGPATTLAATPPRQTKAALLRAQLCEPGGVSLAEMIAATGWQVHTVRAALSGVRKSGWTLTRRREGAETIYAIEADPAGSDAPSDADQPALSRGSRKAGNPSNLNKTRKAGKAGNVSLDAPLGGPVSGDLAAGEVVV